MNFKTDFDNVIISESEDGDYYRLPLPFVRSLQLVPVSQREPVAYLRSAWLAYQYGTLCMRCVFSGLSMSGMVACVGHRVLARNFAWLKLNDKKRLHCAHRTPTGHG